MTRQRLALRALVFTVATTNLFAAGYLLAIEHTVRGPGLLIVLAVILIVAASRPAHRAA